MKKISQQYKVGIIGCGMIAGYFDDPQAPGIETHAKAYFHSGETPQLGFWDPNRAKSEVISKKFAGQAFASFEDLVRDFDPDVISICSPDDFHTNQLLKLLQNSPQNLKLIFLEKPLCTKAMDLEKILSVYKNAKIPVIVNHSRRFDRSHQNIANLIRQGSFGKLIACHVEYYGGWTHLGIHAVDFLRMCFGDDISFTSATELCDSRYENDPTLNVEGTINGQHLLFQGNDETHYQILEFKFKFEKGMIKINDFGNEVLVYRKTVNVEGERVLEIDEKASFRGRKNSMERAIAVIFSFLKSGSLIDLEQYSLEEAAKSMRLLWSVPEKK